MNGLHELPLIIFTVLAQVVVGAWLLCAVALCQTQNGQQHIVRGQFILLILLAIGFIASVLHLGSPWRAFNSLNRVGQSMLSNEIATGALFFAAAGIYWLLAILHKLSASLLKIGAICTALLGLVFMYMMANLYQIPTVPTWHTSLTSWQFYLTLILGGSALAYAFLANNPEANYCLKGFPVVYFVAFVLVIICAVYQLQHLAQTQSAIQSALNLVPDYAPLTALRFSLLGLATWLILKAPNTATLYFAAILVIVAEFIGRALFYAVHLTQGMAING